MFELAQEANRKNEWIDKPKASKYHYLGELHIAKHSLIHMLSFLMFIDNSRC